MSKLGSILCASLLLLGTGAGTAIASHHEGGGEGAHPGCARGKSHASAVLRHAERLGLDEATQAEIRAINAEAHEKVQGLLTEDQKAELETIRAERRAKYHGKASSECLHKANADGAAPCDKASGSCAEGKCGCESGSCGQTEGGGD